MTSHKHLKQLVRTRMQKTGERYAAARRHVIGQVAPDGDDTTTLPHLPGNIPATVALRVLLTHAGVRAPHTGEPFSESMLFGIAGGIGVGVFSFRYEHEDISTLFLAGRHWWHDDEAYLRAGFERFGIAAKVEETGSAKAAEQQLRAATERGDPAVAWVDMALLPHRAMPAMWQGSGYHVVPVYRVDDDGTALIGDLSDEPIPIGLPDLAAARARIKKQRHRLLTLAAAAPAPFALDDLVQAGLRRCHDGLLNPTLPGAAGNARLEVLRTWATRLAGSKDKESWERVFRPGANLWRGLCAIYDFVEHYGTGGGLCRPLFADFLAEAGQALRRPELARLAERYAALGRDWSELADAALPDDIPELREAKGLYLRKAELLHAGGPPDEVRAAWRRLDELAQAAAERFPLSDAACAELRAGLRERVLALYDGEVAALEAIASAIEKDEAAPR
jgi:hypothetical protein